MSSDVQVWYASPWLMALVDGTLYGSNFFHEEAANIATEKLENGGSPKEIFGWSRGEVKWSRVRSIAWVPSKNVILIGRGLWQDPWRIETPEAENLFHQLSALIPNPQEYVAPVSPNDLKLDPRVVVGAGIAIVGLLALLSGAIDGVAPVRGQFIAIIGQQLGLVPVLLIGASMLLIGVMSLIWWYFKRPLKHVVRRTA